MPISSSGIRRNELVNVIVGTFGEYMELKRFFFAVKHQTIRQPALDGGVMDKK
jgi:hypothetical protein